MTMRLHLSGAMPRAVLLAVIVALTPLPVAADTSKATAEKKTSLREATSTIVPRDIAPVPATRTTTARAEQGGSSQATRSTGFFKTKTGVVVLAVFAAGVGYALYSAQNDRITSPAKQ